MSRYRLKPSREQEEILLRHRADARYACNLCVEQESRWRPGRDRMPGFAKRCRQLTGFRIVHLKPDDVRRLNRRWGQARIPKARWVRFRCVACAYTENADVNAARNIAAGHAVTAWGVLGDARPVNREPQPELLPAA